MTDSEPRRGSRLVLAVGLAAMFGGLWLFLDAQGVGVPPFKRLWPTLLLLASGAALAHFFMSGRRPGSAGWAVAYFGFAVLGFALSMGYTNWQKILDWLPSFPAIIGVSLLTTWIVDRRREDHFLIAGTVLVALALMGYAARFEALRRIVPSAQVLWAGLLLVGGAYLVWRTITRMKR